MISLPYGKECLWRCGYQQRPGDRTKTYSRTVGLKQGDRIEFVAESGRTLVRRARKSANPFAKYAGKLGTFRGGKKEINAWLRDLREE